ncbi:MAG: hypothetical protein AAFQ43_13480, partial [Bacteroidota bacterium]
TTGPAYAFARWRLTDALASGAPEDPDTGFPFVSLGEVVDVLEEAGYSDVAALFAELDGAVPDRLPLGEPGAFPLPGVLYVDADRREAIAPEALAVLSDLDEEADWTWDLDDDPEDIEQVLGWVTTPFPEGAAFVAFLYGDL